MDVVPGRREERARVIGPLATLSCALALVVGCNHTGPRIQSLQTFKPAITSLTKVGRDIWLGSKSEGLIRLPGGVGQPEIFGEDAGLSDRLGGVQWVLAHDSHLWLATAGGVVKFSPKEKHVTQVWTAEHGLGSHSVRSIAIVRGDIWAATIGGISRLLPGGKRWKNYDMESGLPQNHAYRFFHDGKILWASSINGGLVHYAPAKDRWVAIPQDKGLGNKYIYSMIGGAGGLWLGTAGGVNFYSTEQSAWDEAVCVDGFTDYCVYATVLDGDRLWFGTAFGLFVRDLASGRQEIHTVFQGLPENEITGLLLDERTLWIATTKGISTLTLH